MNYTALSPEPRKKLELLEQLLESVTMEELEALISERKVVPILRGTDRPPVPLLTNLIDNTNEIYTNELMRINILRDKMDAIARHLLYPSSYTSQELKQKFSM